MKLNIKDRLVMGSILPQKGSMVEQIVVRDIVNKVELTQDELVKANITVDGSRLRYEPNNDFTIDVEFSNAEINLLLKNVREIDRKGEVTQENISLIVKLSALSETMEEK